MKMSLMVSFMLHEFSSSQLVSVFNCTCFLPHVQLDYVKLLISFLRRPEHIKNLTPDDFIKLVEGCKRLYNL